MRLDVRSLLAVYFLLSALCAAVSAYTWFLSRKRVRGTFRWFIGLAMLSIGIGGLAGRGYVPDWASIIAANAFVMAGSACQVWGVGEFLEAPRKRLYLLLPSIIAACLASLLYHTYVSQNLKARVFTLSFFFICVSGLGIFLLASPGSPAKKHGTRFALGFYVFLGAVFAVRAVYWWGFDGGGDWMAAGGNDGAVLLAGVVFTAGAAFAGLELVNGRLFTDFASAAAEARERNEAFLSEHEKRSAVESSLQDARAELASAQKEIMITLSEVVESRSEETAHHVLRVSEYARILARALGLDEEEVRLIADAAPMHDIGKIAVPDSVLKKPGPLTPAELAVMRTHTVVGRDILAKSRRKLMKTAAVIAYEHHEYWDGTGYPEGRKGEAISTAGRIVAACDVFDALSVSRVYKEAWDLGRILNFFREKRGRMFEPRIVDVMERALNRFVDVSRRFPDAGTVTHGYGPD